MANDWIKMRVQLRDDPAVIGIAAATEIEEDTVVGKLHRLWGWADAHTDHGRAPGITAAWVDRYVACPGFAAAMERHGWITFDAAGVTFPRFDRHNGESAKKRAKNVEYKRMSRLLSDKTLTREEKSREEKREDTCIESVFHKETYVVPTPSASTPTGNGSRLKAQKRCPDDFQLTDDRRRFGFGLGLVQFEVTHEFAKMKDYEFGTARKDWDAVWRNWCRTAAERKHGGTPPPIITPRAR